MFKNFSLKTLAVRLKSKQKINNVLLRDTMAIIKKYFNSLSDLRDHLKTHQPSLYVSSGTSTVIPFEALEKVLDQNTVVCDLSGVKGELQLVGDELIVKGHVTWKEVKEFCNSKGYQILTSPTEELAGVLAGIATSCTGERSFGFGNLRSQVKSLKYLDFNGEMKELFSDKRFFDSRLSMLNEYQKAFKHYENYKNAPYPRFLKETDLMTGTEGQLGIIVEATLNVRKNFNETYLFFKLPKWTEDFEPHLEIYEKVQKFRDRVFACEFLDYQSLEYIPLNENPAPGMDLIFLEIDQNDFEAIYEDLVSTLTKVHDDQIFEMTGSKCRALRVLVPRSIFEMNSRMGVTKKGTDVQVDSNHFRELLLTYKEMVNLGVKSNLFGHFGDAHLHFNYMPTKNEEEICLKKFDELYAKVLNWKGSPFAEHGIGVLKKKFIAPFHKEVQLTTFKELKKIHDPYNQFFPQGFMTC